MDYFKLTSNGTIIKHLSFIKLEKVSEKLKFSRIYVQSFSFLDIYDESKPPD